ncbi:MAG: M14 family metallopeptidase, partial [Candidatus Thermoplasmatota archaeon]
ANSEEFGSDEREQGYHSYSSMRSELEELASKYQSIINISSIGLTYEEREILVIKISDNPKLDEDEPEVLYVGAHHGNEKPSYEVLIYFINYLAEKYYEASKEGDRVRWVVNNRELYIIPMLNPDGVEANERKNREPNYGPLGNPLPNCYGVDLNRNYGYKWELFRDPRYRVHYLGTTSNDPYSDTYRGEEPFSEAETVAIKNLAEKHNFVLAVSYHTFGEIILYPWGYTDEDPPDEELFISIGNNISKINGYEVAQSSDFYWTLGDATDWLYGELGVLPYTIELGEEHSPPYEEVLSISKIHVEVNLYIAEIAEDPRGEWIIRGEPLESVLKHEEKIFEDTPATIATTSVTMIVVFGIVYGGLFKCFRIALRSERKKYAEGSMEE